MPALSISDKFALELVFIIKEHLSDNNYSREQLELQILLTLSKNIYTKQLLFRDLDARHHDIIHNIGGEIIHDQAITYLYQVLGRRLRLARNLIAKPTNMHLLLTNLCKFSIGKLNWTNLDIIRCKKAVKPIIDDDVLRQMNTTLEKQIALLGENYSDESARRRHTFGPLYLHIDQHYIELPEEMSFFDVIDATPKQLSPDCFTSSGLRNMMIRVIKSLNERYMLVRSCGLDLHQWLESAELSISNLRDMKRLRRIAEYLLRYGETRSSLAAYRHAFNHLQKNKPKIAGCKKFNDFVLTKHGSQLMKIVMTPVKSHDDNKDFTQDNTLEPLDNDSLEDTVIIQLDSRRKVKQMLSNDPHGIDEVMKMVFNQVITNNRSLFDNQDKYSLLHATEFRQLIDASPEYRGLNNLELVQKIYLNAETIIEEKLKNNIDGKTFTL